MKTNDRSIFVVPQGMNVHRTFLFLAIACQTAISTLANDWTQSIAPNGYWWAVASSADGVKVIASDFNGSIYLSTNSGATWFQPPTNSIARGFHSGSVASAADGIRLVALDSVFEKIYTSSDSGITWQLTSAPSFSLAWHSVASSGDGTNLAAGPFGTDVDTPIFVSTNSGLTWTETPTPNGSWRWVASSADGTRLAAINWDSIPAHASSIYTSIDSGNTWTNSSPAAWLNRVASSADGNKLVLIADAGFIYTSTDAGQNWMQTSAPSNSWYSVASSADGTHLIAGAVPGYPYYLSGGLYTSTDSGVTWTSNNVPVLYWYAVASSADGNSLVAVDAGGQIWTSRTTTSPELAIQPADNHLLLSWLVPSTTFVVQQSPDLTNWTALTNAPTLNTVNLHYELLVSPTDNAGFYRLATP